MRVGEEKVNYAFSFPVHQILMFHQRPQIEQIHLQKYVGGTKKSLVNHRQTLQKMSQTLGK